MNTVQYIFAAVEGGLCSALAMAFIIASTTKMNLQVCRGREVPWAGGWHSSCHPHGLMALIIASTAKMNLQVHVCGWVWVHIEDSSLSPRPQRNAI